MKIYATIFFLLFRLLSSAQDLDGYWQGTLDMPGGCFPINNMELQIFLHSDSVSGNSYHYEDIDNYVKKKFVGFNYPPLKKIILQETLISTYKIPVLCRVCIKKYELYYSRQGSRETLSGQWSGYINETGAACGSGNITLTRIKESAFKEAPEIEVDTGTIRLDFYDNATTDGDSISVLVNGRMVLTHQKLTAHPITTYVKIDLSNTFQEVEMLAENLGSIPPNTALLVVTAGSKRYQLSLSSTQEKSAKVRFVYNKGSSENEHEKTN